MMLHAKTSRSRDVLADRITSVKNSNNDAFFQKWIVDYKHESILDMGTLDIIIEDIPHREAFYLLMHPCLSAIESSTRYIDWTYKSNVDPFYKKVFSHMKDLTRGKKDLSYLPYDVARGFISMDDLTCINLKTSVRVIRSFVYELHSYAPKISDMIKTKLIELFPSLGIDQLPKHYVNRIELFLRKLSANDTSLMNTTDQLEEVTLMNTTDRPYSGMDYDTHPKSQHIKSVILCEDYSSHTISIDYGCYRDLRRHRSLHHFCPEIKPSHMHPFYMHYLTEELSEEFNLYIKRSNPVLLGMEVTVEFRGRQIDIDYMLETRRHSTSHPILRSICRSILVGESRYEIDYENLGSVTRSQQENLYNTSDPSL